LKMKANRTQLGIPTEETKRRLEKWQKEADSQARYKDKRVSAEYEEWLDKYYIGEPDSL